MMSQNRQDAKDRVRSELDFDVNRRAEAEIQSLSRRMGLLTEKVEDLSDMMRPANATPRNADGYNGSQG
jgi:CRP/FNR family transcriptional regulator, cyclic AMP receptor protein